MISKKIKIYEVGLDAISTQLANMCHIDIDFSKSILLEFFTLGGCLTLDEYIYCLEIDNIANTFKLNLDVLNSYD
jgi:hypothetical protein